MRHILGDSAVPVRGGHGTLRLGSTTPRFCFISSPISDPIKPSLAKSEARVTGFFSHMTGSLPRARRKGRAKDSFREWPGDTKEGLLPEVK